MFLVVGLVLSAMCRGAVSELIGPHISAPDRVAGALLGAVRVVLLAVLMVLIFDRIIPAGREPAFLAGSQAAARSCRWRDRKACASCRPTSPISSIA